MDMKITNIKKFTKYTKDVLLDGYKFGKAASLGDYEKLDCEVKFLDELKTKVCYKSDLIVHGKIRSIMSGVIGDDTTFFIYTDKYFEELSEECQNAIYFHELGHIKNKHYVDSAKRKFDYECEADAYMVDVVGKEVALKALKEIREYTIDNLGFYSKEIDRRINVIENM